MSIQSEIVEIGARLYQGGFLSACDGNISAKTEEGNLLVTPAGRPKGKIQEDELALMNLNGEVIEGKPSSETLMHLAVYAACPNAKAVVHAHPIAATAWSIAFPELKELPATCCSEMIPTVGRIPIVPYARPGTKEMGEVLKPFLPGAHVLILSNHGALSWGSSLEEAYHGIERLEHIAKTLSHAHSLGGLSPLPTEEIDYLHQLREKIGSRIL